jgi:hypothetical protein
MELRQTFLVCSLVSAFLTSACGKKEELEDDCDRRSAR